MYEMKPEYYTGIELIDSEHAKLFELANDAHALIMNEFTPDKYDYIVELIHELKDYAKQHFQDEESYMESIQYRKLFMQKIEHQRFVDKLDSFDLSTIDEHQEDTLLSLIDFLATWLIDHILDKDVYIGK